ncbi:MAG TPA: hypothetical protein VEQ10_01290, partial [Vicinamibacteria bacterium]|nr:hypothetical protein [Vicinamibacteria bacterium]
MNLTPVPSQTASPLRIAPVALLLLVAGCGGSKSTAPQTPTVIAAPTPSPTATPSSFTGSCTIGKGDINAVCAHAVKGSELIHYVETAIDLVVR